MYVVGQKFTFQKYTLVDPRYPGSIGIFMFLTSTSAVTMRTYRNSHFEIPKKQENKSRGDEKGNIF